MSSNTISDIKRFQCGGIGALARLSRTKLLRMIAEANHAYCNTSHPILTDTQYDILREYVIQRNPEMNPPPTSAPSDICKVKLPCHMGSMNKIKPDTAQLSTFLRAFPAPHVSSYKLDGISALYYNNTMSTRGDGTVGQNISHALQTWNLPQPDIQYMVRGECIMRRDIFQAKYAGQYANARCLVAGALRDQSSDAIHDIEFIAYEVIQPTGMSFTNQWAWLTANGFSCVPHKSHGSDEPAVTNDLLSAQLHQWRTESVWDIDGIILAQDTPYIQPTHGNPAHAVAFKMVLNDQLAEAKVVQVHWNASKDGYLKPRVEYEPVVLGGTTCTFATGVNGAFIRANKIGVGAIICIVRSGDVIPHIHSIVEPADEPQMPSIPYLWTSTGVDCVVSGDLTENDEVQKRVLARFFREIKTEEVGAGIIARCFRAGYNTIPRILRMTTTDFREVCGGEGVLAEKLTASIREATARATLVQCMVASNIFPRGFSHVKLASIVSAIPDVCTCTPKEERVAQIPGLSVESAHAFVTAIAPFVAFMHEVGLSEKLIQPSSASTPSPSNSIVCNIVLTGTRDKRISAFVETHPFIKVQAQVTQTTDYVVTSDASGNSKKLQYARTQGIPICTPDEFMSRFS